MTAKLKTMYVFSSLTCLVFVSGYVTRANSDSVWSLFGTLIAWIAFVSFGVCGCSRITTTSVTTMTMMTTITMTIRHHQRQFVRRAA